MASSGPISHDDPALGSQSWSTLLAELSNRRNIFCARIDLVISSMDFRVFSKFFKSKDEFWFLRPSILEGPHFHSGHLVSKIDR